MTNVLPAGATFVSATSTLGTCTQFQGVVTCALGTLNSNQTATLTVISRPTVPGALTNTAVVVGAVTDPIPGNNSASTFSIVEPAAELALNLTGPGGSIVVTSNLVFSLTVSNRGPTFATNVTITAALPPNTLFNNATPSQGSASLNGNLLVANLGQMNAGATATLGVSLRPMLEGVITNSFSLTAGVFDPVPNNNSASAVTTVTSHPAGPILRIALAGTNAVLYWTTNSAGYSLFFKPDELIGSSWRSLTNPPVVRGTQFFVTNAIAINPLSILSSGGFYRLQRTTTLSALTITRSGTNVTLTWPVTFASWTLQSTPELVASNLWTTLTNNPTLVSGRYYLTQAVAAPQQYYRLNPP